MSVPTGDGAKGLEKPPKKEPCCVETITVKHDNETITIFDKNQAVVLPAKHYIITNNEGKSLPFKIKKAGQENCKKPDEHQKNFYSDSTSNPDKELNADYKFKFEKIEKFKKYLFLPIPTYIQGNQKTEIPLFFPSCKNKPKTSVIPYPDIDFTIELNLDFATDEEDKKKEDYKGLSKDFSFLFTTNYNDSPRAKDELKIDKDGISVSKELKYKTDDDKEELDEEVKAKLEIFKILSSIFSKAKKIDETIKELLDAPDAKVVKPDIIEPNITFNATWQYDTSKDLSKIGRLLDFTLKGEPLIGAGFTIDLLQVVLNLLTPGMGTLYRELENAINSIDKDDQLKVYFDLELNGQINLGGNLKINTADISNDTSVKLDGNAEVSAELKVGIFVKAKTWIFVTENEISGSASSSIKGGGYFKAKFNDGLFFSPYLLFDGLKLKIVIRGEIGLKIKVDIFSADGSITTEATILPPVELISFMYNGVKRIYNKIKGIEPSEDIEAVELKIIDFKSI